MECRALLRKLIELSPKLTGNHRETDINKTYLKVAAELEAKAAKEQVKKDDDVKYKINNWDKKINRKIC